MKIINQMYGALQAAALAKQNHLVCLIKKQNYGDHKNCNFNYENIIILQLLAAKIVFC